MDLLRKNKKQGMIEVIKDEHVEMLLYKSEAKTSGI